MTVAAATTAGRARDRAAPRAVDCRCPTRSRRACACAGTTAWPTPIRAPRAAPPASPRRDRGSRRGSRSSARRAGAGELLRRRVGLLEQTEDRALVAEAVERALLVPRRLAAGVAAGVARPHAELLERPVDRPGEVGLRVQHAEGRANVVGLELIGPLPVSYTHLTLPTKRI